MPIRNVPRDLRRLLLRIAALFCTALAFAGVYEDLLLAADMGDTRGVIALLQRGLDVNTTDRDGNTLLMMAARNGNAELAAFLMKNRASLFKFNRNGDDALMLAAFKGDLEIVKALVAAGADLQHGGWGALHYAAFQGHAPVAGHLLQHGAPVNGTNGQTALMLAANNGHAAVCDLLLAAGAETALVDPQGKTAADLARSGGNTDLAQRIAAARSSVAGASGVSAAGAGSR